MSPTRRHGPEVHRANRSGWLRAAVLGANDGIVSTASLIVGVAGSGAGYGTVRTAGIAAVAAGALSMAAGEYVSVSAQRDAERADLRRERTELRDHPASELAELAEIWRGRGLDAGLAQTVAEQLTEADALGAHARDELGLVDGARPAPVQAAATSALAFAAGALFPLIAFLLGPRDGRSAVVVVLATLALAASGAAAGALGGAPRTRAAVRVAAGGLAAMLLTMAIGEAAGAALG
ncbi:MAG: VIT1/CCC1 transporter family protein [Acidimicrobiales bacterium]|nr:VIT1/CCC1 transporter family protein [Acidimicrobiales bacterium]